MAALDAVFSGALREQAVLFRASQHSDPLEIDLFRRGIPFVKFGGLKFLEAGHVKDLLALLRWVENPRDRSAGFRVLKLIPGIGPATARRALDGIEREGRDLLLLDRFKPPASAAPMFAALVAAMKHVLAASRWQGQIERRRCWSAATIAQDGIPMPPAGSLRQVAL